MSERYPGGLITKTPVVPSGSLATSSAPGVWTLDQQLQYKQQGLWPTAGNSALDAQFNYVTMLLHGDGTNGAQNNTFLDSSSNTFSITRNGNTTQGSFSPYGSNWSNYFDGTGDYLSIPSATASGTSSFCFEAWIYPTNASVNQMIIGAANGGMWVGINIDSANKLAIGRSFTAIDNQVDYTWVNGQWYHVAVNRNGTSLQFFVNGVQVGATGSNSVNYSVAGRLIGAEGTTPSTFFYGYISNARVVNASVYTTTFTPPTAPLTAIANTTLLTCQSNRFVDNSTNNFTVTPSGNTSVQRFNPFGASTAYSTGVIGGSGYFDGSGDYLACGSQSAYAFGTGDFTLNVWVYLTAAPTYMSIADTRSSGWALAIDANRAVYLYTDIGGLFIVTSAVGAVPLNAWTYVSVKRVSGTMTLYLNAVSINSAANSTNFSNTTLAVGANTSGGEPIFGYICDFQAIKGTGTTPTLPTAPLTNVANTSLLLNYQNGAIFDNAMMNNLETVGNAQISTSVYKYGTGSLAFDGTGDWLVPRNLLPLGSSDFTVEMWLYPNATYSGAYAGILDSRTSGDGAGLVYFGYTGTANQIGWKDNTTNVVTGSVTLSTWNHVAVVRSSGTMTMYINGTSTSSSANSTNYTVAFRLIGASFDPLAFNGYIDDLRITTGYARYTANFTAPTAAFPNVGPN